MSFSVDKINDKLQRLDATQQSIQSTSQWCLFHHRHHKEIVALWLKNLRTLKDRDPEKSLVYFYLCNDLIQFSKKNERKFRGYLEDFVKILPQALTEMKQCVKQEVEDGGGDKRKEAELIKKYVRVLSVWGDRSVFDRRYIAKLTKILDNSERLANASASAQKERQLQAIVAASSDSGVPESIRELVQKVGEVDRASTANEKRYSSVTATYEELLKNFSSLPEPHQFIDKLNGLSRLSKTLSDSLESTGKLRTEAISELEKAIEVQKGLVEADAAKVKKLAEIEEEVVKQRGEISKLLENEDEEEVSPMYEAGEEEDDDMPVYSASAQNKSSDDESENEDKPDLYKGALKREAADDSREGQGVKKVKFAPAEEEEEEASPAVEEEEAIGGDLLSILHQLT